MVGQILVRPVPPRLQSFTLDAPPVDNFELNPDSPLIGGLAGYWPLVDGTGRDLSYNGNTASYVGSPPRAFGVLGPAVSLNGTSQYVNCGQGASITNLVNSSTGGLTASVWLNLSGQVPGSDTNSASRIFEKRINNTSSNPGWIVGITNTGTTGSPLWQYNAVTNGTTGVVSRAAVDTAFQTNVWTLATAVFSGSANSWRLYINGIEGTYSANTTGTSYVSDSGAPLYLGFNTYTASGEVHYFWGQMAHAAVWNRALSPAEVLTLYTNPFDMLRPVRRAYQVFTPSPPPPTNPAIITRVPKPDPRQAPNEPVELIPDHPFNNGLVGFWPLIDGTAQDWSVNGTRSTVNGSPQIQLGPMGPAMYFNGSTAVTASPPAVSGSYSVSAWFAPKKTTTAIIVRTEQPNQFGFQVYTTSSYIIIDIGDGTKYLANSNAISYSFDTSGATFYFLTVVVLSSSMTVYINGASIAHGGITSGTPVLFDSTHTLSIGGAGGYFLGPISNVAFHNRALSAAEVEEAYLNPWGMVRPIRANRIGRPVASQAVNLPAPLPMAIRFDPAVAPTEPVELDPANRLFPYLTNYWMLNDASGNDLAGFNGGTFVNPVISPDSIGPAPRFSGSQSITTANPGPTGTGAMSLSVWFKTTDTTSGSAVNAVLWWGDYTQTATLISLFIENGSIAMRNSSSYAIISGSYNDGKWHHVVWTKGINSTSAGWIGYVDGVQQSITTSGTTTLNILATNPVTFGSYKNASYFNGSISNVAIFDTRLAAADVATLYEQPFGMVRPIRRGYTMAPLKQQPSELVPIATISRRPELVTEPPRLIASHPLAAGLQAWWTPAGGFLDLTDNGYNGTNNGVSQMLSPFGAAYQFDGTSSYIDISPVPTNIAQLTVSAWIDPTNLNGASLGGAAGGTIVATSNSSSYHYTLGIRSASNTVFWSGQSGSNVTYSGILLNTWSLLTATYDGSTGKIYLNGELVASGPLTISSAPTEFRIGAQTWLTGWFAGGITDVRLYNRALTAAEVLSLHTDPNAMVRPVKRLVLKSNTIASETANVAATVASPKATASVTAYAHPQLTISTTLALPTASASLQEQQITLTATATAPMPPAGSRNLGNGNFSPPLISLTWIAPRTATIAPKLPMPLPSVLLDEDIGIISVDATVSNLPQASVAVTFYQMWKAAATTNAPIASAHVSSYHAWAISATVAMPSASVSVVEEAYIIQPILPLPNASVEMLEVVITNTSVTAPEPSVTSAVTIFPAPPPTPVIQGQVKTLVPSAWAGVYFQAPVHVTAQLSLPRPQPYTSMLEDIGVITAAATAPLPPPGSVRYVQQGVQHTTPPLATLSYRNAYRTSVQPQMPIPKANVLLGGGAVTLAMPLVSQFPIASIAAQQVTTMNGAATTDAPAADTVVYQDPTAVIAAAIGLPVLSASASEDVPVVHIAATRAMPTVNMNAAQDVTIVIDAVLNAPIASAEGVPSPTPLIDIEPVALAPIASIDVTQIPTIDIDAVMEMPVIAAREGATPYLTISFALPLPSAASDIEAFNAPMRIGVVTPQPIASVEITATDYVSIAGRIGAPMVTIVATAAPPLKRGTPISVFAIPQVINMTYPVSSV